MTSPGASHEPDSTCAGRSATSSSKFAKIATGVAGVAAALGVPDSSCASVRAPRLPIRLAATSRQSATPTSVNRAGTLLEVVRKTTIAPRSLQIFPTQDRSRALQPQATLMLDRFTDSGRKLGRVQA